MSLYAVLMRCGGGRGHGGGRGFWHCLPSEDPFILSIYWWLKVALKMCVCVLHVVCVCVREKECLPVCFWDAITDIILKWDNESVHIILYCIQMDYTDCTVWPDFNCHLHRET